MNRYDLTKVFQLIFQDISDTSEFPNLYEFNQKFKDDTMNSSIFTFVNQILSISTSSVDRDLIKHTENYLIKHYSELGYDVTGVVLLKYTKDITLLVGFSKNIKLAYTISLSSSKGTTIEFSGFRSSVLSSSIDDTMGRGGYPVPMTVTSSFINRALDDGTKIVVCSGLFSGVTFNENYAGWSHTNLLINNIVFTKDLKWVLDVTFTDFKGSSNYNSFSINDEIFETESSTILNLLLKYGKLEEDNNTVSLTSKIRQLREETADEVLQEEKDT